MYIIPNPWFFFEICFLPFLLYIYNHCLTLPQNGKETLHPEGSILTPPRSETIRKQKSTTNLVGIETFFWYIWKKCASGALHKGRLQLPYIVVIVVVLNVLGWKHQEVIEFSFFFSDCAVSSSKNTCWNVPKAWLMSTADLAPPCWTAYFRHKHPKWSSCFFLEKNDCKVQHPYPKNTWNMVNLPTWMVDLYSKCR